MTASDVAGPLAGASGRASTRRRGAGTSAVERWSSIGRLAAPASARRTGRDRRRIDRARARPVDRAGEPTPRPRAHGGSSGRPSRAPAARCGRGGRRPRQALRDGDHHRVAHADLGVALPAVEHRAPSTAGDQLAGLQRGALRTDHELGERDIAPPGERGQVHDGVERGEHGQPVAGRRRTCRRCRRSCRRCGSAATRRCGPPGRAPARTSASGSAAARRR